MALTPEDVVNKRFQPTKFREGYDQDEVDDFLDEVVVELRRLNQENEELRQRLIANDSRINELQRNASQAPPVASAPAPSFAAAPAPAPAEQFAQQAPPTAAYSAPSADAMDPNNTNNLLQLARRLHEEHVREGVEKRDALIAEGQEQAARVVQEAEESSVRVKQEAEEASARVRQEAEEASARAVQEAEETQRNQIGSLEQQRQQLDKERLELEQKVDELRTFEREYRQKLKGYIEGQLRELDSSAVLTGASAPQQSAYSAPAAQQPPAPTFTGFGGAN